MPTPMLSADRIGELAPLSASQKARQALARTEGAGSSGQWQNPRVDVLKACLSLDDLALGWVCSQLLLLRNDVLVQAIGSAVSSKDDGSGERQGEDTVDTVGSEAEGGNTQDLDDTRKPEEMLPSTAETTDDGLQAKVEIASVENTGPPEVEETDKRKDVDRGTRLKTDAGNKLLLARYPVLGRFLLRASAVGKPVLNSSAFVITIVAAVIVALFGTGIATLADLPDDPGLPVVDFIMMLVTLLFISEMVLQCLVSFLTYPLSFFFWMDLLGTISMVFEISFLAGTSGQMQTMSTGVDAVLMRTARAAKVGARIGRLSKLMKYITYYFSVSEESHQNKPAEAKVLSQKLMLALSTKVSMLTIVLVFAFPLFSIGQYPEQDLSMLQWSITLEQSLSQAYLDQQAMPTTPSMLFQETVLEFIDFYHNENYKPFRIQGFGEVVKVPGQLALHIAGASQLQEPNPGRISNIFKQSVPSCILEREHCMDGETASLYFDFKAPRQIEAAEDMALIVFIIFLMLIVSLVLSNTLDKMVVQPMERMLNTVKTMAGEILQQFGLEEEDDQTGGDGEMEETELIEGIFKKFARLASLAAERNEVTEEQMAGMDADAKGVMMQMMNVQVNHQLNDGPMDLQARMAEPAIAVLPVAQDVMDSFNFDVLSLSLEQNVQAVIHILFDSKLGRITGRTWTLPETFGKFHASIMTNYTDAPYHNYKHAVDVMHTVFRLLSITRGDKWLSTIDQYALLIAALCHDLGHQGKTNPFLVETQHELAMVYNDKSPLENMHCAKLFEIASNEECDVFKRMDRETKKSARKVCIATILHTDNVNHFEMVREISKVYELASDTCDAQALADGTELLTHYQEQVLQKNSSLWLELFLHFADVSNPLKPFSICKAWAWRVLDEFFDQGDIEKKLTLPVGLLNDRDKINRPGSQHGFINFMVAPLVLSTVKLFPNLHTVYTQMANNVQEWRNLWVKDAKPSPEEIAKKDADVSKIKETARELERRTMP